MKTVRQALLIECVILLKGNLNAKEIFVRTNLRFFCTSWNYWLYDSNSSTNNRKEITIKHNIIGSENERPEKPVINLIVCKFHTCNFRSILNLWSKSVGPLKRRTIFRYLSIGHLWWIFRASSFLTDHLTMYASVHIKRKIHLNNGKHVYVSMNLLSEKHPIRKVFLWLDFW